MLLILISLNQSLLTCRTRSSSESNDRVIYRTSLARRTDLLFPFLTYNYIPPRTQARRPTPAATAAVAAAIVAPLRNRTPEAEEDADDVTVVMGGIIVR